MTINHSSALNEDLVPAQEKLEWVTPKISLMDAEDTEGGKNYNANELDPFIFGSFGPS